MGGGWRGCVVSGTCVVLSTQANSLHCHAKLRHNNETVEARVTTHCHYSDPYSLDSLTETLIANTHLHSHSHTIMLEILIAAAAAVEVVVVAAGLELRADLLSLVFGF